MVESGQVTKGIFEVFENGFANSPAFSSEKITLQKTTSLKVTSREVVLYILSRLVF